LNINELIAPGDPVRRVVAVIQARMASSRLPGKVLADLAGSPMLWHVVSRVRRAKLIDKVVVATSDRESDDPTAVFCEKESISCFRGSEEDVLDRYYRAAKWNGADVIVRVTADCPLIDPVVVDKVIDCFLSGEYDLVTNNLRHTFPVGLDTEVFSLAALERAWVEARDSADREHVSPYLRSSDEFRLQNVENDVDLSSYHYHWVVNLPAEMEFARRVYAALAEKPDFGMEDVVALLECRPDISR
tara:strand:- start:10647 stop:11381 length:735 start_codon:yes stop_codon:yes gene_type:complete